MEDLSFLIGLVQSHPLIAAAIAVYLLFFRGSKAPASGGGFSFATILVQVLKFLLARLETPPTDPNTPPSTPAPFDFAAFLKKLLEELFKAKESGDKEHEEAVLKVMKKCEHCSE